jgi:uncharacterized protein (TIGR03437 family)
MQSLTKFLSLIIVLCALARAQINIVTANGNNDRTNANLQEYQLSPATVAVDSFGKIGAFAVDGQVYAQPLYASGISIPGKGSRNVVFVATMHNTVYAFDAGASPSHAPLWQVSLGASLPATLLFGRYGDVGGEVGVLGTGAIDLQRGVLYVVAETLRNGTAAFYLHALDLATGGERLNGPVMIAASVTGTGSGALANGTIPFNPQQHIQRPGLLLANNSVYVAFGSHADQSPWHGWLMSYDASDVSRQAGVYVTTPTGDGGSFWQSGRGLAADNQGNVYALTGNGDYDGVQNFSQSFLKLSGAAPARVGSYTPPDWKSMSDNDFDLSAGPALISGTHTVIGADKMGYIYVLNGDAMGTVNPPGAGGQSYYFASESSIFNFAVWSRSDGPLVFVQGSRAPLMSYRVNGLELDTTPAAIAQIPVNFARIGMTLSADGARMDSGILWETSGNYNDATAPGTLRAYRASDLTELWSTDMNRGRDIMGQVAKFVSPTVANGRVYVATFGNVVTVYGLFGAPPVNTQPKMAAIASAASYEQEVVSPGEMIAIFGSDLGPATPAGMQLDETGSVPTMLAETRVLFDGVPGPMVYAGATQVNAIVPFGVSGQSTRVQVEYRGQVSIAGSVAVAPATPAIFAADGSGSGQAIAINQDGTINSANNPAPAGSVVVLYATGAGQSSPAGQDGAVVSADNLPVPVLPVLATVGDQGADVLYAGGAPGFVQGVLQVNLRIADGVTLGDVPVVLQVGDRSSRQGVTIAVQTATALVKK